MCRFTAIAGLLAILFLTASAPCADDPATFEIVSNTFWGGMTDIAISGDYAFCAMKYGLDIVDISDLSAPILASRMTLGYWNSAIRAMALKGDYLYLCRGPYGLTTVDISDPSNPVIVDQIDQYDPGLSEYTAIVIDGDYAYTACEWGGMRVYSLADPAKPEEIAVRDGMYARYLAIKNGYAYSSGGRDGLFVFDIGDPSNPVQRGTFALPDTSLYEVSVGSGYAYMAGGFAGLLVLDISDLDNLHEIGRYDVEEDYNYCNHVYVRNSMAYVDFVGSGLLAIDVTDPAQPRYAGTVMEDLYPWPLYFFGDTLYTRDSEKGLLAFDVPDPLTFNRTGGYRTSENIQAVAAGGGYAYLHDEEYGIIIADISDAANPVQVGFYVLPIRHATMELDGSYLHVLGDSTYYIFDVSTPSAPAVAAQIACGGEVRDFVIWGAYSYVANKNKGLMVFDISDPAAAEVVGNTGTGIYTLERYGDYLIGGNYAAIQPGLQVIDISNPEIPQIVFLSGTTTSIWNITLYDTYALAHGNELMVYDISIPTNPVLKATLEGSSSGRSIRIDDLLLVSNNVYDMTIPAWPFRAMIYDSPGQYRDSYYDGNYLYVADGTGFLITTVTVNPDYSFDQYGDVNGDGTVNVGDAVFLVQYIFKNGPPPEIFRAADTDCNYRINIADAVFLVSYIFKGGPPPQCP